MSGSSGSGSSTSTGWDWSHPIDSIGNWFTQKKEDAKAWMSQKIQDMVQSAGESAMKGIKSAVQSSGLGNISTADNSSGSGLSDQIGALLGASRSSSGGPNSPSTSSDTSSGSGFSLASLFGGNSKPSSTTSTDGSGQQQDGTASSGGMFGNSFFGMLLAFLVIGLLSGFKGLMNLFGGSSDSSPSSPDDNIIQKGVKTVQHWGHEAYEWAGQKIDNIAGARGIRNNNPGNLEKGHNFNGEVQGDDGRFATFRTAAEGTRAMGVNLLSYDKRGINTVTKIVNTWAPAGDGSNNPKQYAQNVAGRMGVDPNQTLNLHDPKTLASLMRAMAKQEDGVVPYPPELFAWAANSAINQTPTDKAPILVAQGNGRYSMQDMGDSGQLVAASYTPQSSDAASGGLRRPLTTGLAPT